MHVVVLCAVLIAHTRGTGVVLLWCVTVVVFTVYAAVGACLDPVDSSCVAVIVVVVGIVVASVVVIEHRHVWRTCSDDSIGVVLADAIW